MDIQAFQKELLEYQKQQGFNTTDVLLEFGRLFEEAGEAFEAYRKKKDDLGEELADVMIFLCSIAEMNGINLEEEVVHKMEKNRQRVYRRENGVLIREK